MKVFDREKNSEQRMRFVEKWADYVRTHPDTDWSMQQKVVVDSQLKSLARPIKE
ncbi:MAG: hypothetical protein V1818_01820 [Candidatus Aenigmatarchaeota archaeon]